MPLCVSTDNPVICQGLSATFSWSVATDPVLLSVGRVAAREKMNVKNGD